MFPFLLLYKEGFLNCDTMSKAEIYQALKTKGIFDTDSSSRDDLWAQAFHAYYKETKVKLKPGCGGCMNRVRNWLKS